ncbi:eotaxin-like isoform X1 [Sinocyclocheilus grahami]|uniref:eotaxin-like isoform X1 n=1 Tax=Sinocyclocheilus grahami TaxID=75366 RepID=UPI0007ACEDBB|nr:PREDICTED: eotaxin-like isoform X1 [Sinocyclocheilus grahami]
METRRILMRSLAVAVVMASVIWTTTAAGREVMYSCCNKVSTAKVTDPIIDIRLQHESLPCVKAVIFETKQVKFCSDPKQRWVREKVKQFFKKNNITPRPTSSISD